MSQFFTIFRVMLPREKLLFSGVSSLSNDELLALFLRTGSSTQSVHELSIALLKHYPNLSQLARSSAEELCHIKGIGTAKACELLAAVELGKRISREQLQTQNITQPEQLAQHITPLIQHEQVEVLLCLPVNSRHQILSMHEISRGTINQTIAHPRDILQPCLLKQAYGFFIVHNHPSGNPQPSPADDALTAKLGKAADLLEIKLLDHLIIGQNQNNEPNYYSYQNEGKL